MSEVEPRPAATIILVRNGPRHGDRGLEALMVRRNPAARFMPGVWVFPGGSVTEEDRAAGAALSDPEEEAHRACVRRELAEEAGLELEPGAELWPWSRWITPEVVPIRFDTRFYLAAAPPHAEPKPDGAEVVDATWAVPAQALEQGRSGEFPLEFPTIKHLEELARLDDAGEAVVAAHGRTVAPVLPRVIGSEEDFRVVLPGDPEYF